MSYDKLLTKNGHSLFTMSSLMQKAIRRGDKDKAGYACNELISRYPDYVWKKIACNIGRGLLWNSD